MKCFDFSNFSAPPSPEVSGSLATFRSPANPLGADEGDGSLLLCATANPCIPRGAEAKTREGLKTRLVLVFLAIALFPLLPSS